MTAKSSGTDCAVSSSERVGRFVGTRPTDQQAITQALESRPQVVVLDFAMPVMNGLTAARILKKVIPGAHLILFSISGDLLKPEELRSAGFAAVVPKSQVRSLLDKAQGLVDDA